MVEYIIIDDLEDRIYFQYPYFSYFTLSDITKREHKIDGWLSIAGLLPDGSYVPLYDVWAGKEYKYLNKIYLVLTELGKKTGIIIK